MKKGFIPIVVYALFILSFCYASTKSLWVLFFGLSPYVLGGAGIITFFVGYLVQKCGKTTLIRGRVMYGVLIVLIALGGCTIAYGLKDSGRIDGSDIWREDTYYTLAFSFIGAMTGQFFAAGKEKRVCGKLSKSGWVHYIKDFN